MAAGLFRTTDSGSARYCFWGLGAVVERYEANRRASPAPFRSGSVSPPVNDAPLRTGRSPGSSLIQVDRPEAYRAMPARTLFSAAGRPIFRYRGSKNPSAILRRTWGRKKPRPSHPSTPAAFCRWRRQTVHRTRGPCGPAPDLRSTPVPQDEFAARAAAQQASAANKLCRRGLRPTMIRNDSQSSSNPASLPRL